jgi:hypothetical protein
MAIQLYHSGSLGAKSHRDTLMRMIDYRLLTLHPQYIEDARRYIRQVKEVRDTKDITLLFDSGAFTAWKKKQPDIEVKDLLAALKNIFRNLDDKFKAIYAISLDKIPGEPNRTPSEEEIRSAIRISDENHRILSKEFGSRILPVFHQGESIPRLSEVLELNSDYICISPRNDVRETQRRTWAQRSTHKKYLSNFIPANTRTHGLATTGNEMMLEVPWYSIDSAAIIQIAAFGNIILPINDGNNLQIISVSKQSPNKRRQWAHLDMMKKYNPAIKKLIEEIMDKVKVTEYDLQTEGGARELCNAYALIEAAKRKYRPTPVQDTLFAL